MDLNLGIPGDGGGAASDSPPAGAEQPAGVTESVEVGAGAAPSPATPTAEGAAAAPALEPPATPATPQTDDGTATEPTEEELEAERDRFLADPTAPDKLKNVARQGWGVAAKRKEALTNLQTEFETFKSQYDGKEVLPPDEITRLRGTEDTWLKLTGFTATPDDVLGTIKEANPRVYRDVLTTAAWNALEKPDGTPDFENLQAIVDKFSAQYGESKVEAKDVMQVIQGLASGKIDVADLKPFGSPAEYEAWERTREQETATKQAAEEAKASRNFAEEQVRSQFVTNAQHSIQQQFREPVLKTLDTFKLNPIEGEPKVATDFKQGLMQELGMIVSRLAGADPHLREVDNILQKLTKAGGLQPQEVEAEIQQVLSSPGYSLRLQKGLSAVQGEVEKLINQRAVQYRYMMMGYEAESSKKPPPVPGRPHQQPNADADGLTEDLLKNMTAAQRSDYYARRASQEIRRQSQSQNVPIG